MGSAIRPDTKSMENSLLTIQIGWRCHRYITPSIVGSWWSCRSLCLSWSIECLSNVRI